MTIAKILTIKAIFPNTFAPLLFASTPKTIPAAPTRIGAKKKDATDKIKAI